MASGRGLGGCHACIKYLMFAFNFIFWVSHSNYILFSRLPLQCIRPCVSSCLNVNCLQPHPKPCVALHGTRQQGYCGLVQQLWSMRLALDLSEATVCPQHYAADKNIASCFLKVGSTNWK